MKKDVIRAWSLVLQIGLSVIVPIFLLLGIGLIIKDNYNIDILIILIIVGLITGIRNVYYILKNYINMMDNNKDSELLKRHNKHHT